MLKDCGQDRRDPVPHRMGLRVSMEEQERRAMPADSRRIPEA